MKKIDGFIFLELEMYHKEKATNSCFDKIYDEIILKHFDDYLDELFLVNTSYLNLLEKELRSVNEILLERFKSISK